VREVAYDLGAHFTVDSKNMAQIRKRAPLLSKCTDNTRATPQTAVQVAVPVQSAREVPAPVDRQLLQVKASAHKLITVIRSMSTFTGKSESASNAA